MCFTNPICIFLFFGVIMSDCQVPKFTENMHKIAQHCVQNVKKLPGWGVAEGGNVRMGREERHGCWGG